MWKGVYLVKDGGVQRQTVKWSPARNNDCEEKANDEVVRAIVRKCLLNRTTGMVLLKSSN